MLLDQILQERILILDGAMGTMLQRHGLCGNSEEFNFSAPDIVGSIHKAYIDAGADIISTNSFSANRISQEEYGKQDLAGRMAFEAARIARQAADSAGRKVWVAGSIGPTGKSLTLAQDLSNPIYRPYSFDQMADAYREQILGLIEGGADLLLMETCFDALNTKAAIYALSTLGRNDIPLMISVSASDRSGRTLTGQTVEAFYRSVEHSGMMSFGLNCSLGAEDLAPLVEDLSHWAECAVSCHPNAGLPNEMGAYDQSPETMAAQVAKMASKGLLNITGGCCGTTPEHIAAIAGAVRGIAPRKMVKKEATLHVSGLEAVEVDRRNNFTNVGERTNVAGSRKFARLIAAGDYESALKIAADQIENGARIIDINMDDAMLDSAKEMTAFLRHISSDPAVARAALMIDSSHFETVVCGLKNAQGKCIVNSISLKEGEEAFLRKAREIRALGAAVVVMAFDEQGQATDYARKIEISRRSYGLLREAGFPSSDIIFDVNVLSVGTGIAEHARYGIDFIEAVHWIKENLPGALTSGGISNLSFAFRGNNAVREAMHSVFLYHAAEAGLDMGIVNPGMLQIYDSIEPGLLKCVEDVILDSDPKASERLLELASTMSAQSANAGRDESSKAEEKEDIPAEQRISRALVRGGSANLEADLRELLDAGWKAVGIIEGPLMDGMARVGELFGAGKMFLPQVVKSAKVMREAVAFLQPYMEQDADGQGASRPKILMATVKGDVHDIGKNITGIVLGCNGFEVTDLGVMVPKETILEQAALIGADIIGVSGLITPSLFQMEELCREMAARGLDTPLLIGGATTSALHTAVKLAPLYDHVFYASDASASAVLAGRLMSERQATEEREHLKQKELLELYRKRSERKAEEAAPARQAFSAESYLRGKFFEDIRARSFSTSELLPYFDWQLFYAIWGIKPGSKESEEEMARLNADAVGAIDKMVRNDACRITLCARFDACRSSKGDIVCKDWRLPMLRQSGGNALSLSDFVAPASYGFDSPAGMFAISVHDRTEAHHEGCDCPACKSDYLPMLERSVRLTLAEAASSWLDEELKKQLKAQGAPSCKVIKPAAGYASCPDHSLKRDILRLLPGADELNIKLTGSCAMIPDASICGLIFVHPEASYPEIRSLSGEDIDNYARKRGMDEEEKKLFLSFIQESTLPRP